MKAETFACGKCNMTFAVQKPRQPAELLICPDCKRPFSAGVQNSGLVHVAIDPSRFHEWEKRS